MLVDGQWQGRWSPYQKTDKDGRFLRQTSSFRNWVTPDGEAGPTGDAGFKAEKGRYHLYVALICPWASRTLMARSLLGLEDVISVSVTEPYLDDDGWSFGDQLGADRDPIHGFDHVHQLYSHSDSAFTGKACSAPGSKISTPSPLICIQSLTAPTSIIWPRSCITA